MAVYARERDPGPPDLVLRSIHLMCLSRPWSTNTISPCDPFIVARTSQTVNARPAGTDGEKTRRRRRRRMAGTGLRRHGQPHSEPRRATVGGHGNNIHCADRQGVIDDHRHAHHHHHHRAPARPRGRSSSSSTNNHRISSKQQRSSSITNSPDPDHSMVKSAPRWRESANDGSKTSCALPHRSRGQVSVGFY